MVNRAHIAIALAMLFASACLSAEEKIERVALNFVDADYRHAAPFRSYLFISAADQAAMTIEEYAEWHVRSEQPEAEVSVEAVELDGERATVAVAFGSSTEQLVLVHEDNRWRVELGLGPLEQIRGHIEASKAARASGNLDEALQELERAAAIRMEGTLAEEVTAEVDALRQQIEGEEARRSLIERLDKAKRADLSGLEKALPQLEREATDDEWSEALAALRKRLAELRTEHAMDNLRIGESKVRRFYEGVELVYEIDLEIRNEGRVPVDRCRIRVEMLQAGVAIGEETVEAEFDGSLAGGESSNISHRFDSAPMNWKSREFETSFMSVEVSND